MTLREPVIIIGMHRSGTSMLTRTLQGFGLYMGRGATRNEECRWTNLLNEWMFRQASATWERPEGMDSLLADPVARPLVTDYLTGVTGGPAAIRYLGLRRWLRYRSLAAIHEAWGWKDPRNTFTLPLWLEVFPRARVLHIMRHGVDVAESLRSRRARAMAAAATRYRRGRRRYVSNPFAPKRSGFAHSPRVGDPAGGLDLWRAYTDRARRHVQDLGASALEMRYEDLLFDPDAQLRTVTEFCGLEVSDDGLARAAAGFRPDRAFAYRSDPALTAFAQEHEGVLRRCGYEP